MKLGHPIISVTDNIETDTFDNDFIRLNLNKPKLWNWKLTTSKSSPNIIFPRIQLVDPEGTILAEANEAGCVFDGRQSSRNSSYKSNNSNKSNGLDVNRESSRKASKNSSHISNTSVKSAANNVEVDQSHAVKENSLPRKKSYQKIKRERSDVSINNRRSFRDSSSSASSDADEDLILYRDNTPRKPKYIYRTCSAGTLIVCEESFYKYKRRRPKGRKYKDVYVQEVTEQELIENKKPKSKRILKSKTISNLVSSYNANDVKSNYCEPYNQHEREKASLCKQNSIKKSASSASFQQNSTVHPSIDFQSPLLSEDSFYKYKRRKPKIGKNKNETTNNLTDQNLGKSILKSRSASSNLASSYKTHTIIPENDEVKYYRRSSSVYEKEKFSSQCKENSIRKSASSGCFQRQASDRLTQACQRSIEAVSEEDAEDSPRGKRRQLRRKIVRKNTG